MTIREIVELFEYNDWANDKFVVMISNAFGDDTDLLKCEDDRVVRLQEVAVHTFAANSIWRCRLEGESPKSMLQSGDYPTPLDLKFAFGAEKARFIAFLDTISNEPQLDEPVHYRNMAGEPHHMLLKQILTHMFTHSMYHRGQISALLMELGYSSLIESTDIASFYLQKQSR